MVVHDPVPEERCDAAVAFVARAFVFADGSYDLRNLHVPVMPRQRILPGRQRPQKGAMVETLRQVEVFPFAGQRVDVGQRFGHAAVFAYQDPGHLLVRESGNQAVEPIGETDQHGQRFAVGRMPAGVHQPGELLVQRIEGHPAAVQVESLRPDVAALQFGEELAAAFEAGQQAGALRPLAFIQSVDAVVDPVQQGPVARGGVHHRQTEEKPSGSIERSQRRSISWAWRKGPPVRRTACRGAGASFGRTARCGSHGPGAGAAAAVAAVCVPL